MEVAISQDSIERVKNDGLEAVEMARLTGALVITTDAHYTTAAECLREITAKRKQLEKDRKDLGGPLLKAKQKIDAYFKPATTSLAAAEKSLKSIMGDYQLKLQRERAEAARKAEEAARKAAPVEEVQEILVKAAKIETPKVEGVSVRMIKKFEISDPDKLPRHLLVPDTTKIRSAVMSGVEVPGVRVWEEPSIATRSN